nr:neuroendocrine protein 7b2 [Hymenolepis microstoma]
MAPWLKTILFDFVDKTGDRLAHDHWVDPAEDLPLQSAVAVHQQEESRGSMSMLKACSNRSLPLVLFHRKMDVLLIFCVLSTALTVQGSNYDAFLANLALRNREHHERFRRDYPNGDLVLDHVFNSPEFRSIHPVLLEYEDPEDLDASGIGDSWSRLMDSLAYAEETARHPDSEVATKRLLSRIAENPMNNTPIRTTQRSEYAPQNHLSGTHAVSGGSSEDGSWIAYAISGALAQEDDDDKEAEENTLEGMMGSPLVNHIHKSQVKTDKLPGYCDPPNPCAFGYDPESFATPCDMGIENTAEFNKRWIVEKMESGECTCDDEHMLLCERYVRPKQQPGPSSKSHLVKSSFYSNPYLRGQKRSNEVAKKTNHGQRFRNHSNPFAEGENLKSIVKKSGPRFIQA